MLTALRKKMKDRRRSDRILVTGCVAILRKPGLLGKLGFGPVIVGQVVDIGPGGACVLTNASISAFERFDVRIQRQVGEGGIGSMHGRAVWVRRDPKDPTWTLVGVALAVDARTGKILDTLARACRRAQQPQIHAPRRCAV